MRETITMGREEQRRALVLTKVVGGAITMAEAAALLRVHERTVYRLRAAFLRDGPRALVHGNRGRPSPARIPDATRARVLELARGELAGANDCHLVELLGEHGISLSRVSVRRILRGAGIASPRRRRPAHHRSRRERMPQAGLLL
jgi:transposase